MVGICLTQGTAAGGAGVHVDVNGLPASLLHHGHPTAAGRVQPKPLQILAKFQVEGDVSHGWTLSEGSAHPI